MGGIWGEEVKKFLVRYISCRKLQAECLGSHCCWRPSRLRRRIAVRSSQPVGKCNGFRLYLLLFTPGVYLGHILLMVVVLSNFLKNRYYTYNSNNTLTLQRVYIICTVWLNLIINVTFKDFKRNITVSSVKWIWIRDHYVSVLLKLLIKFF